MPTGTLGAYLHVPFCRRRCPYCDFAVAVVRTPPIDAYVDALVAELDERAKDYVGRTLRTVYFGGGTPSFLAPSHVRTLLDALDAHFGGLRDEVTLEVNPEDVDASVGAYREAGVTRVSLGVQSFDDATLQALGRAHSGEDATRAIAHVVAAGFEHVSVDLILGGEAGGARSTARALSDVARVSAVPGVDHVSAYDLTIEARTAFDARIARGEMAPVDTDAQAAASRAARDALSASGFERYEVSNYARGSSGRARHNSAYWAGHEYLGVGVGAHSLRLAGGRAHRRANGPSLRRYLAGEREATCESLDARTHLAELIMVGVRTRMGVDFDTLASRFGGAEVAPFERRAEAWAARGLVTRSARTIVPTELGLETADVLGFEAIELADP